MSAHKWLANAQVAERWLASVTSGAGGNLRGAGSREQFLLRREGSRLARRASGECVAGLSTCSAEHRLRAVTAYHSLV
jgi:hypothetical protein